MHVCFKMVKTVQMYAEEVAARYNSPTPAIKCGGHHHPPPPKALSKVGKYAINCQNVFHFRMEPKITALLP